MDTILFGSIVISLLIILVISLLIVIFVLINHIRTITIITNTTRYKHFKGGLYEVLLSGLLESDPSKVMTIYRDLNDNTKIWVRDATEFYGHTKDNIQRFVKF